MSKATQESEKQNSSSSTATAASGGGGGGAGGKKLSKEEAAGWHGYVMAEMYEDLPPPQVAFKSDDLARPNYTKVKAQEYIDTDDVLDKKADLFIKTVKQAKKAAVFGGAGLGTSSMVCDYASSHTGGSVVQAQKRRLTHDFVLSLRPSLAHRVLTLLAKGGPESAVMKTHEWVQQNHDGLAQKAGFGWTDGKHGNGVTAPVNEIHGAWLDSKHNPVIKMSGSLRDDLFERVLGTEKVADFCFAIGSSLSGLNVDRVPLSVAKRHKRDKVGLGTACLAIQRNPFDDEQTWALRIFDKCDHFMALVAKKLDFEIDFITDYDYATGNPVTIPRAPAAGEIEFDGKKKSKFSNQQKATPTSSASSAAASSGPASKPASTTSAVKSPARLPASKVSPTSSPQQKRSSSNSPELYSYPATAHKSPSQPTTSFKSPPAAKRPSKSPPTGPSSSSQK